LDQVIDQIVDLVVRSGCRIHVSLQIIFGVEMPRVYIIIVDKVNKYTEAVIDLNRLPAAVMHNHLTLWWENGEDIVRWFQSDLPRATRIVTHLANNTEDDETLTFLNQLYNLWESVFSLRENKDGFFCAMPERGGFIRSSPEGVLNMVDAMRNGLNPF
jgi:hypothetical protein